MRCATSGKGISSSRVPCGTWTSSRAYCTGWTFSPGGRGFNTGMRPDPRGPPALVDPTRHLIRAVRVRMLTQPGSSRSGFSLGDARPLMVRPARSNSLTAYVFNDRELRSDLKSSRRPTEDIPLRHQMFCQGIAAVNEGKYNNVEVGARFQMETGQNLRISRRAIIR
jgi:hypothetical protein